MRHAITLSLTVCLLAATAATLGQTTRPDAALPEIKVNVWTCTEHDQFRLRKKGPCPLCERTLVRERVAIRGPDVTVSLVMTLMTIKRA